MFCKLSVLKIVPSLLVLSWRGQKEFLNQVRAGHMPGFLKLFLCGCLYACVYMSVCVCVYVYMCVCPRLLITSGMMWCDIDPIWLVK